MAMSMGPSELSVLHGDEALRANDLATASATYIIGTKNGGEAAALNFGRIGMTLVARIDEEKSFAGRAKDIASEKNSYRNAEYCQQRAQAAFTESLKIAPHGAAAAHSFFGSAECLVEEAMLLDKQVAGMGKLRTKPQKMKAAELLKSKEKLHRHATKRYASAYARNRTVNLDFDTHLPLHLDSEGLRTLPKVHAKYISENGTAFRELLAAVEESAHAANDEHPVGQDRWSTKVATQPPHAAAVGKYDAEGTRADQELAHFRRQHEKRMQAAYSEGELRAARHLIFQGLKAGHIKANDKGGHRVPS